MKIFIGYDPRETAAYRVCIESLKRHSSGFTVQPVNMRLLGTLYRRPTERRGGVLWDVISDAPMSTEFSIARFWTPLLAGGGLALFCDCDFLWRADVAELFALADSRKAVQVVKHDYEPAEAVKMDGQPQTAYPRKNWSSLMLINCDHSATRQLTVDRLNGDTGRALHSLAWAGDDVGALPLDWNWLEGVSPPIADPKAVHFTRGTPDMPGYENAAFADEWRAYARGAASS